RETFVRFRFMAGDDSGAIAQQNPTRRAHSHGHLEGRSRNDDIDGTDEFVNDVVFVGVPSLSKGRPWSALRTLAIGPLPAAFGASRAGHSARSVAPAVGVVGYVRPLDHPGERRQYPGNQQLARDPQQNPSADIHISAAQHRRRVDTRARGRRGRRAGPIGGAEKFAAGPGMAGWKRAGQASKLALSILMRPMVTGCGIPYAGCRRTRFL
ncbi:hypothetical protein RA307_10225, partial [Xanthobacteraceae bacterium Astr-EGSB]|uniref:hypothetical protein n=1 Tax=Astrobacterium formosum TaxID=3069710 RepID=UPI0027B40CA1|nr:hypothetical protein [Xanthobacteraceae bacterium Astr-EGSB]